MEDQEDTPVVNGVADPTETTASVTTEDVPAEDVHIRVKAAEDSEPAAPSPGKISMKTIEQQETEYKPSREQDHEPTDTPRITVYQNGPERYDISPSRHNYNSHQDLSDYNSSSYYKTGESSNRYNTDYDPDYSRRLYDQLSSTYSLGSSYEHNVRDRIYSHPVLTANRPDAYSGSKISSRSRSVMRKGFDLGFTSPLLKQQYDV